MDEEETCNTGLVLGIGCGDFDGGKQKLVPQKKPPVQFHLLFPPYSNTVDEEEVEKSKSMETDDGEDCIRNGNDNSKSSTRKKLRLTKEQSGFLEDSFKERNTLTPTEKQELAKKLNLRPRQVEVWFQNRRARTKLKQMEVDCELLKKCCESLSTENRRLKKELQELKTMKVAPPFYIQLPKAAASAVTMCPSCNRGGMSDVKTEKKEVFDAMKGASMTC